MRYAFAVFEPYRAARKAAIFGSARTRRDDPLYAQTVALARELADADWMVITGAGPGIMEAGIEGAGAANSFGVSIRLPFEAATTQFLADDPKLVNFRYFFTRKVTFVKEAHAFVLLPGGFGTLDEGFELLTLVQTGKAPPAPIVLLDVPGGTFWLSWVQFVERELRARGYISPEDMRLVKITDDPVGRARRDHRLLPQLPLAALRRRQPRAADAATCPSPARHRGAQRRVRRHRRERAHRARPPTSKAEIADDDVPDLAAPAAAVRPAFLLAAARADRPAQRAPSSRGSRALSRRAPWSAQATSSGPASSATRRS